MDASSPLAAMRPPPMFGQRVVFGSERDSLAFNPFGAGFNNGRGQMRKLDYFNVRPMRGSSPTASLAADLSQNFRIDDASPQMATPRRALFTKNMIEAMETREYVTTTPTLPASSSPLPTSDMMDMTPLPRKAPIVSQMELPSPTLMPSPDDMMVDSPSENRPPVAERKRAVPRRPSLTRVKGYSTSVLLNFSRLHPDEQLSSVQFSSPELSSPECFGNSPSQDRRPQTANSPCSSVARPKPHFGSLGNISSVRNGSPINSHARRPSNPLVRPRKMYRRSLSMFESPGDVMRTKRESVSPTTLQVVADMDEPYVPLLPHHFPEGGDDSIPRISRDTMLDVLDGKFCDQFDDTLVIDCRFEYEYEGGHIDGAVNHNDKEFLAAHLFGAAAPAQNRRLIIFHCEYSAHRAPIMARHIRAEDRNVNVACYPRLTYPEVYILEGGYSSFFAQHRDRCYPQAYVEMDDTNHVKACEREMDRLRHHRKGLSRAQTYSFGQQQVC